MLTKKTQLFLKNCLNKRQKHSWTLPIGHNTSINVYNCVTRQNEPLIVKNKEVVTWYTCGPTVYDDSHIGHGSCYVKLDIIQRILKNQFGLNLVTCMNITDIDDKIIKKARELKTDFYEVSKKYEKDFWNDLSDLGIPRPDIVLRVSENIPLIINFIDKLEQEGVAYRASDNSVYFDASKSCHPPGRLQNISVNVVESQNPFKKAPADFALWKGSKTETEPYFDSPWGKGRPGWHIECSTLASHIFGSSIDIHAGGLDLRFPHHENEEIQSCAFHGNQQWVNYWLHTGHLQLKDSVKMSKSLKNTVRIQDMLKETKPEVFRLACAMSHYSSPMEYSSELMTMSMNVLNVYKNFFVTCSEVNRGILKPSLNSEVLCKLLKSASKGIHDALCDNFNTPQLVHIINQIVANVNSMMYSSATNSKSTTGDIYYLVALSNLVSETLNLFGIDVIGDYSKIAGQNEEFTDFIDLLVHFRQDVRTIGLADKNKDLLKLCDSLRDNLRKSGLNVKDHGKVSSWSR